MFGGLRVSGFRVWGLEVYLEVQGDLVRMEKQMQMISFRA